MSASKTPDLSRLEALAPEAPDAVHDYVDTHEPVRAGSGLSRGGKFGVAAVAGIAALAISPVGGMAADLAADLAGIGEEPSLPQVASNDGTATVIASGMLDGTVPYEIVAKRANLGGEAMACFQVDWPADAKKGGGGLCTSSFLDGNDSVPTLETTQLDAPPAGGADGPAIFLGIADDPAISRVTVSAGSVELPTQTIVLSGPELETVGGTDPVTVFAATLDGETHEAINANEVSLTTVATDGSGRTVATADTADSSAPSVAVSELPQAQTVGDVDVTPASTEDFKAVNSANWTGISTAAAASAAQAELVDRGVITGLARADAVYLGEVGGNLIYVVALIAPGVDGRPTALIDARTGQALR